MGKFDRRNTFILENFYLSWDSLKRKVHHKFIFGQPKKESTLFIIKMWEYYLVPKITEKCLVYRTDNEILLRMDQNMFSLFSW